MRKYFVGVIFILLAAIVAVGYQSPTLGSLPQRLSDTEHWKMIDDFSEPGGNFVSPNYVSNEIAFQQVIPDLQKRITRGGVYLGVAPEQNFTYIAAIQPKIAFIIDIRRQNMLEHLMYKALFEISKDRAEFVSRLFSRPDSSRFTSTSTAKDLFSRVSRDRDPKRQQETLAAIEENLRAKHRYPLTSEDMRAIADVLDAFARYGPAIDYNSGSRLRIQNIPNYYNLMVATDKKGQNWSYLQSDERFLYIKDVEERNLIVPLVGDFSGPKTLQQVAMYLRAHNATVSVFYVSNVEDYLGTVWRNWITNVDALPAGTASVFIRLIARQSVIEPMNRVPSSWPGPRGNRTPRQP
jgi:hypothetical protein